MIRERHIRFLKQSLVSGAVDGINVGSEYADNLTLFIHMASIIFQHAHIYFQQK